MLFCPLTAPSVRSGFNKSLSTDSVGFRSACLKLHLLLRSSSRPAFSPQIVSQGEDSPMVTSMRTGTVLHSSAFPRAQQGPQQALTCMGSSCHRKGAEHPQGRYIHFQASACVCWHSMECLCFRWPTCRIYRSRDCWLFYLQTSRATVALATAQ